MDETFLIGVVKLQTSSPEIAKLLGPLLSSTGGAHQSVKVEFRVSEAKHIRAIKGVRLYGFTIGNKELIFFMRRSKIRISWSGTDFLDSGFIEIQYEPRIEPSIFFERIAEPLIFLANVATGHIPVHSSAFEYEGRTFIITGWTQIGKTEMLLQFVEKGGTYLSDDWTLLYRNGMIPYSRTIKLSSYNLTNHPHLRDHVETIGATSFLCPAWNGRKIPGSSSIPHRLDYIIFAERHSGNGLQIQPIDRCVIKNKMISVLTYTLTHYVGSLYSVHLFSSQESQKSADLACCIREISDEPLDHLLANCSLFRVDFGPDTRPSDIVDGIQEIAFER